MLYFLVSLYKMIFFFYENEKKGVLNPFGFFLFSFYSFVIGSKYHLNMYPFTLGNQQFSDVSCFFSLS